MAGADINAKDIDGNTPCHFCSEYGHKDCLRYLLLKHPSLFSKNKEGLSPLDVAVNTEILQVSNTQITDLYLDFLRLYQ
jgi:ankyrin repeat protein